MKNIKNLLLQSCVLLNLFSCSSKSVFTDTSKNVDLMKFMGRWYVIAGRFTFLETGVHNAIETYTWNENKQRIDIDFRYNKDSVTGEVKTIPQKGWVEDKINNSHWLVTPLWPLKFDYLIVDVADDYSWTVIGVPTQKYIWIMARDYNLSSEQLNTILKRVESKGYDTRNLVSVPHKY